MIQTLREDKTPLSPEYAELRHVLLVLDQFPRILGGGERIVLKLAALLPQYGYRVSILTFFVHPESTAAKSAPCPVYLLPLERTYDLKALRGAIALSQFLKAQQIQIVQTFFESSDLWAGAVTKALSSTRLIWSRRDMGILRARKHKAAYRLLARVPDAVFAVAEEVRRHVIEVDGVSAERVFTIYNGLDLGLWETPHKTAVPGKQFVMTTGNIRHVKGHDVFIRAAAALAPRWPDVTFSIAGDVLDPDYFAQLQALIQKLGLSEQFQFFGGVTNLPQHLAQADIFVLPSRSEGFSNAILEAMAASLPLVATAVGGNAEAVQNGVTGFIVAPDDPAALAASIEVLLADPALATSMGVAGRARAAEYYSLQRMMQQITSVYANLLAKG